jgi:hypothetical protein
MKKFKVLKASGEYEVFDPEKLRRTILDCGASEEVADYVLVQVEKELYDGISTGEIFEIVLRALLLVEERLAYKYDLKGAIMRLGPNGYNFEDYVAAIFNAYGFRTKVRQVLRGKCVSHEVDILMKRERNGKKVNYFGECKYRNAPGLVVNLKEALYTYARFLDLNRNGHKFTAPWLITNTRFTKEVEKYSECVGLKLLSWKFPPGKGLEKIVEKKKLYPITIIRGINRSLKEKMVQAGIILAKELTLEPEELAEKLHLPVGKIRPYVLKARVLFEND